MRRYRGFATAVAAGVFLLCSGHGFAQTQDLSISDATTPPGIASGAQLGSFSLSGFESVNLFSGALNFSLPVLTIGGRGEARYSMMVPVETRWEAIEHINQDGSSLVYPTAITGPSIAGYAPGHLDSKPIVENDFCGSIPYTTFASTRFHFTMPDGEDHDLVDVQANGSLKPTGLTCVQGSLYPGTPYNRGRTFVSYDGSEMSFVADADVLDLDGSSGVLTGYVLRKDGVRYRIDSYGTVSEMEDRNGNYIRFSFCSDPAHDNPANPCTSASADADNYLRPVRIIDPLGRLTTIEYGTPAGSLHPNEDHIVYPGASGQQRTIIVRYAFLGSLLRDSGMSVANVNVLFPSAKYTGDWVPVNDYPNDPLLVSEVVLPNGLTYQFRYNPYGELARATLPTGGYFEYDWRPYTASVGGLPADGIYGGVMVYRRVTERRVYPANGVLERKTVYDAPLLTDPAPNLVVTATDQDASSNRVRRTVSTFWGTPLTSATIPISTGAYFPGWREGKLHTEEVDNPAGALLRKTENTWLNRAADGSSIDPMNDLAPPSDPRITQIDTTLDGNQVSRQAFSFDVYNNVTDEKDYDWGVGGPGGLLRHTETTYLRGDYLNYYLLSLPETVSIRNDSGTLVARTHYGYDEYGQGSSATLVGPGGVVQHDDMNYGSGVIVRGNLTNPAHCVDVAHDCPLSDWINHVRDYDIFGNVVKQYDGNNHATVFSYDGSSCSQSLPTAITNALGQTTTMAYDCNNSKPLSSTDANSVTTAYAYNDNLERLTQVRRAAGVSGVENQTNYIYPDANHVYVYTDQQTTADGALRVDTVYDGLGRVSARLQYGDPAGVIKTETTYDALGRVYSVSNPYRPRETVYWTTTSYDALGRVTSVMTSGDGATVTASYTGNQSTVTDQAGKKRTNTYDALGRLRVVIEDPGGPLNYGTNYFYDALDDLTSVSQGYCPNCQGRTFTYDAVRRLLMATNPESGTVSYGYDGAEIC
jgi:hypothetical protein